MTSRIKRVLYVAAALVVAAVTLAVPCFAAISPAEYNLVASDVLTWSRFSDNGTLAAGAVGDSFVVMNNQGASANVGNTVMSFCFATSIPSGFLVAGQPYSLSFTYPSDAEIIQYGGRTQAQIDSYWSRVWRCYVGLGYFDNDGNFNSLENCGVSFDHSESVQYTGRVNYVNFTMPDYSGKEIVFAVGFVRAGSTSTANTPMYFGRYYGLIDYERKKELEDYNRLWYGNPEGDYTNPYTTESYDVGDASDMDKIDAAFDAWEDGIDAVYRPFRVVGVFTESLFGTGAIVWVSILIGLLLSSAFLLRILGVT